MEPTIQITKNHGGPLHYLGNRFLSLPDVSGHMRPDSNWFKEHFCLKNEIRSNRALT